MIIGATSTDVTSDDSVAFARAMGNQVVQSLALARSVARLTASEKRYRTLLESANDFIAVLTPGGIVREMNHRWVEFTGLPQEQLIGRHVREFAPAGKEDEAVQAYNEAVSTSAVRTPPVEIAGPNGSSAFIEFSITNVNVGGEQLVFSVGRDVTEQQLQRLRVFKATMTTVQDIVNNLLNGFQLVRLEAGDQLPEEMLTVVDQVIHEASVKLKTLGDLETVTEREMAIGPGIDYSNAAS